MATWVHLIERTVNSSEVKECTVCGLPILDERCYVDAGYLFYHYDCAADLGWKPDADMQMVNIIPDPPKVGDMVSVTSDTSVTGYKNKKGVVVYIFQEKYHVAHLDSPYSFPHPYGRDELEVIQRFAVKT